MRTELNFLKGYALKSLKETPSGLAAKLFLDGPACNAFGSDVSDLTIEVTYETDTRQVPVGLIR